jgi:hypothetical protein
LFKLQNLSSFLANKLAKFNVNEVTPVGGVTLFLLHLATAFFNHFAQIGSVIKADSISTNHEFYKLFPIARTPLTFRLLLLQCSQQLI